jgi:hypothetical protein
MKPKKSGLGIAAFFACFVPRFVQRFLAFEQVWSTQVLQSALRFQRGNKRPPAEQ